MVDVSRPTIIGYADQFSVAPGEPIEFKISCTDPGEFDAVVVRLRNGDTNPAGPGFIEDEVDTPASGRYPGRTQQIRTGSAVLVDDAGALALGRPPRCTCSPNPRRRRSASRPCSPVGTTRRAVAGGSASLTAAASPCGWVRTERCTRRSPKRALHAWTWYSVLASWTAEIPMSRLPRS